MEDVETVIIESQTFPVVNYIKTLYIAKYLILLPSDAYKKMSFRNRYVVVGSNGPVHLSVPLVHGRNQRLPFGQVRISYGSNWQQQHWRTLTSCYNKSPWFEYYASGLQSLFSARWTYVFEWNLAILEWLQETLRFPAKIVVSDDLPTAEYRDLRDRWLPKNFEADPEIVCYPQVFEDRIGFRQNLSILDLLFNMGPSTAELLGL